MFRIEFMCQDKHLADILKNLDTKVFDLSVRPAKAKVETPTIIDAFKPHNVIGIINALPLIFDTKDVIKGGASQSGAYLALKAMERDHKVKKLSRGKWEKIS